MKSYDHKAIEQKWQQKWEQDKLYETPDSVPAKENEYLLVEYPYPSGNLHIGHWYAFAVPDIYARFRRMQGKNVLFPIGFDSFGLPAENAAIKRGLDPKEWTYDNIAHMEGQLKSMGNSFDWSRKVVASDPEYYKWTQWLFLQLYEKGLAYKKDGTVPWCDSCKTVLANEQIVNGACERCGTAVVQKDLAQWYLKITDYAERLLTDLDSLDWPEEIKAAQREWIGKSAGALLKFRVTSNEARVDHESDVDSPTRPLAHSPTYVEVFTTRADTLYGATYLVLAPEHPLVETLKQETTNEKEVDEYVEATKKKKELERKEGKEKTGVELKGVKAINPGTKEEIPIWIADYVLASYGTGAIMAVPAHDERDFEFAQKYGLPIQNVIERPNESEYDVVQIVRGTGIGHWVGHPEVFQVTDKKTGRIVGQLLRNIGAESHTCKTRLVNSAEFEGLDCETAKKRITEHVGGTLATQYRLRDWLLSRQRYWGCPIPIVYDPEGKPHAVPDEHLPWRLPTDVDFKPTGEAPLAKSKELRERTERIFGTGWTPEVDTMDTFVDSSWYFLRYLDPKNDAEFSAIEKQKQWMPVTLYSGGAEHTTMHVLYSRFFYKALYDLGLVTHSEPYVRRMNRGLILGPDGAKMSKSKGNVIDPDENVARVGADTVKMYLAFIGPYNEPGQYPWDLGGIAGVRRFLEKVWNLSERVASWRVGELANASDSPLDTRASLLLNQTIKKVSEDVQALKFNTAISALMVLVNHLEKLETVPAYAYEALIRLLAPFAPHLTEELWEGLGHTSSVHLEPWPAYDEALLAQAEVTIAVQVNGKTRGTFTASPDMAKEALLAHAREVRTVSPYLEGRRIVREIVVPGRMVSFVTAAAGENAAE